LGLLIAAVFDHASDDESDDDGKRVFWDKR